MLIVAQEKIFSTESGEGGGAWFETSDLGGGGGGLNNKLL